MSECYYFVEHDETKLFGQITYLEHFISLTFAYNNYNRECHGLKKQIEMIIFEPLLSTFLTQASFLDAAGAVANVGSRLKPNHQKQI